jgi:hypothetical protein
MAQQPRDILMDYESDSDEMGDPVDTGEQLLRRWDLLPLQ